MTKALLLQFLFSNSQSKVPSLIFLCSNSLFLQDINWKWRSFNVCFFNKTYQIEIQHYVQRQNPFVERKFIFHHTHHNLQKVWQYSFGNIARMKYGINVKINPCGKFIPSCLEDYKKHYTFFITNSFISDNRLKFDPK